MLIFTRRVKIKMFKIESSVVSKKICDAKIRKHLFFSPGLM